jgi:hypothetical protein
MIYQNHKLLQGDDQYQDPLLAMEVEKVYNTI